LNKAVLPLFDDTGSLYEQTICCKLGRFMHLRNCQEHKVKVFCKETVRKQQQYFEHFILLGNFWKFIPSVYIPFSNTVWCSDNWVIEAIRHVTVLYSRIFLYIHPT